MFVNIFLYFFVLHHVFAVPKIGGIFENSELLGKIFSNIRELRTPVTELQEKTRLDSILSYDVHPGEPFSALNGTCNLINQTVVAIFGPESGANFEIVKSICEEKGIPQVILNSNVVPSSMGELSLSFYPLPQRLNEAYFDIIKFLEWKEITIIYTEPDSLKRLSYFIEWSKDSDVALQVYNIDPHRNKDYRLILKQLRDSNQKNFFVDCPRHEILEILWQIQQTGMMTKDYSYFLGNLDAHTEDFSAFKYSDASIIGVNIVSTENNQQHLVMNDLCRVMKEDFCPDDGSYKLTKLDMGIALLIDAFNVLTSAIGRTNITRGYKIGCQDRKRWKNGISIVQNIKKNTYTGLTGMISFNENGYRDFFQLTIFEVRQDFAEIGTWMPTREIISNHHDEPQEISEENFRDKQQIVEILLNPPYAMLTEDHQDLEGNAKYEGFTIDLIEEISKLEQFTYKLVVAESPVRGVFDSQTGTWRGMIGDLLNKKVDMAIADLTITERRSEAVDFTVPFMTVGISILYRKPLMIPPQFLAFAEPFNTNFWIDFGKAFGATVISLFIIGRLSSNEWQRSKTCKGDNYLKNQLTFVNCLWFVCGSLFRQNTRVKISSVPARIVSAAWWIFCFVIFATYIGRLISKNTPHELQPIFNNIEELIEKAESMGIQYGTLRGGSTEAFFKNSHSPIYQKVWQHIMDHPEEEVAISLDGIDKVEKENFAFFMESATIEYTVRKHCSLGMYGGLLDSKGFGIAVRKDSPTLLKTLSTAILKLQSSGKINELKHKWWYEKTEHYCQYDSEQSISPMHLHDFEGLMWITLCGAILATVIAFMEFCNNLRRLRSRTKKSICDSFTAECDGCFKSRKKCITRTIVKEAEDVQSKPPEIVELK